MSTFTLPESIGSVLSVSIPLFFLWAFLVLVMTAVNRLFGAAPPFALGVSAAFWIMVILVFFVFKDDAASDEKEAVADTGERIIGNIIFFCSAYLFKRWAWDARAEK